MISRSCSTGSRSLRPRPVALVRLFVAACLLPSSSHAQSRQQVSVPLQPGLDSLFVYAIRDKDTTLTGRVRDELLVRRSGSEEQLVRIYASTDAILGTRLDTIVDRRSDLAPRYHHSQSSSGSERVSFSGGTASGYAHLASGDSVKIQAILPAGAINGASFDLFLRSAGLAVGRKLSIAGFQAGSRTVAPLEARITAVEKVSGEPCWRAEAVFGGMAVHFWIGTRTRRLHQQVMFIRPDFRILFRSTPITPQSPQRRAA